jgi:hypothetical protein
MAVRILARTVSGSRDGIGVGDHEDLHGKAPVVRVHAALRRFEKSAYSALLDRAAQVWIAAPKGA